MVRCRTIRAIGLIGILLLSLLALSLSGTVGASPDSPMTPAFGTVIQDAISVVGEEDDFAFPADAGDIVLVRMNRTSGSLRSYVRIIDSADTVICSAFASAYSLNPIAEIATCTLPNAGTYTLRASDYQNTNTGNYALYFQRLNAPGNTSPQAYGSTASGSITSAALLNTVTFTATAGDRLIVHVAQTSGELALRVRVYDPAGMLRCQATHPTSAVLIEGCEMLTDGIHTILVGDDSGAAVGIYNLHLQRLSDPVGAAILTDSQVHTGMVTAAADLDAYTFSGSVGEKLLLRAAPSSSGGLDPQLRVYDPHGTRVCTAYTNDRIAEIATCALATEGTHTVLVGDYGGRDVGSYDLYLLRLTAPDSATPLAYGATQVRSIDKPARLHVYTFQGRAGEVLAGQMGVPGGVFDPHLRLYGIDGVLVCEHSAYTQYSTVAATIHCILPADQIYVVLAGAYAGSFRVTTGGYNLHLQRLNPPVGATTLQFGVPVPAAITPAGDWDAYAFRAASGAVVTVQMSAARATINPQVRLFGTDGVKLCEASAYSTYMDAKATFTGCTLPFSGTYTLLAGDVGAARSGAYTVHLTCDGVSCGFPLVLSEQVYLPFVMR